ncbi:MAG: hypothetical protein J5735_03375 [Prevotella sp.]|nr:hypothetical protein [Prevotella sp.]
MLGVDVGGQVVGPFHLRCKSVVSPFPTFGDMSHMTGSCKDSSAGY